MATTKSAVNRSDKPRAKAAASKLACLVLAAGKGTRMNSNRVKVLHPLLGAPLVAYAVDRAHELGAAPVVAVLGHDRAAVEHALVQRYGAGAIAVVEQAEQLGTGHAVKLGLAALRGFHGTVLILYGDVPLLTRAILRALCDRSRKTGALAVLTTRPADATGYGRMVRDPRGRVVAIVEHKDATVEQRAIAEVNAGIYAAPADFLRAAVRRLRADNAQGEYYLTDIVPVAARSIGVQTVAADPTSVAGINDRRQLVAAEAVLRKRLIERFAAHATFRDPASTVIEPDVTIGRDVEIGRHVSLRGRTSIGAGTRIDDGVILTDTVVGAGVEVKPYTVASAAVIGDGCKIGPFAHLRPGTVLAADVHVGNFVETKKARLGRGSKANHLTYLGDAEVGEKVNIGAGTITCNYNGYEKRITVIADGAFIGSDSQLVAPVRIGRRAVVAAGATIVNDVPDGHLALSRVVQTIVPGYADKLARRYASPKPAQTEPKRSR